jgi:pyrrolysine biosynthesis protein PylD
MTRLTPEMIRDTPNVSKLDYELMSEIGTDLLGVARSAAGVRGQNIDPRMYTAEVVPVTSGLGVISGFADSVAAALRDLGMRCNVTERPDVAGFYESVRSDADLIFMADDDEFVAYNVRAHGCVDNTEGTARGYTAALRIAAGGSLSGKDVLVVGGGLVGSAAVRILVAEGAKVTVTDKLSERAERLQALYRGVEAIAKPEEAIAGADYIVNCSPAHIDSSLIRKDSVISSPGVPHTFDAEAYAKARVIIHDPLSIGVASMAMMSASLSEPVTYGWMGSDYEEKTALAGISVRPRH